jgi:SAM-dependent methyltransferase
MACPLCNHPESQPSWLGSTFYKNREFPYVECLSCGSLSCEPMPDEETLAEMYGPEYEKSFVAEPTIPDPRESLRVIEWLKKLKSGIFVDYGCGSGAMLLEARKLNLQVLGVEFDDEVARAVEKQTGARVLNLSQLQALDEPVADILYLGDVIEHLTKLNEQMPEILKLIRPGGMLIAQGPLEGNSSLFTRALRLARSVRPARRTEMAPYHVLLATASGQRKFFQRFGLEEMEFHISEVAWPAPNKLSRADIKRVRPVALFLLRRLSQAVSALRPERWGNRYFYAGRWNG